MAIAMSGTTKVVMRRFMAAFEVEVVDLLTQRRGGFVEVAEEGQTFVSLKHGDTEARRTF